jgi:hypothetical protein
MAEHLSDVADTGAFLARVLRLDPSTMLRLRPAGPAGIALWAQLPWGALVSRVVPGELSDDRVVAGADLLSRLASATRPAGPVSLAGLTRRDGDWRVSLPPDAGRAVEVLPTATVRRLAAAAAETLRTAEAVGVGGRAVGQRVLREALLDHAAIRGSSDVDGMPFEISQRLVQAVVRMGFLGPKDDRVTVVTSGRWTGLAAPYGIAWHRPAGPLTVRPIANQTIG